ncbi:MAG TPA: PsiF family protein [Xanthobacteraceae bacterium]
MQRFAIVAAMLAVTLPPTPSFAVSAKDKMETCKFGADDQNLQGAQRDAFIKKCMSGKNEPRGTSQSAAPAQPKN